MRILLTRFIKGGMASGGDSNYPEEFADYLWKRPERDFSEYETEIRQMLPELYWLFDSINEADRILAIDDENEYRRSISSLIEQYPQLKSIPEYNTCLDPVMRSDDLSEDMKIALWQAKVKLDDNIRLFHEEIAEDLNNPGHMLSDTNSNPQ